MDVAKHLAHWQEQPPEQWVRAANRYLPTGVTFLLVVAIAYQLSTAHLGRRPRRRAGRVSAPGRQSTRRPSRRRHRAMRAC